MKICSRSNLSVRHYRIIACVLLVLLLLAGFTAPALSPIQHAPCSISQAGTHALDRLFVPTIARSNLVGDGGQCNVRLLQRLNLLAVYTSFVSHQPILPFGQWIVSRLQRIHLAPLSRSVIFLRAPPAR